MSTSLTNPYPPGTSEHLLWARWHRAFFDQPVHGQMLAIESQLRENLNALMHMNAQMTPSDTQRQMRAYLMEVEESVDLLNEAAEHAFVRIVAQTPTPVNGRHRP